MNRKQTFAKISFDILLMTWLPMIILCFGGSYFSIFWRITIGLISLSLGLTCLIFIRIYFNDSSVWKTEEEVDHLKKQARTARTKYTAATRKIVAKQHIIE